MLEVVSLELHREWSRRQHAVSPGRVAQDNLTRLSFPLETSQLRSGMCARLVIIELWSERISSAEYSCVARDRDQM